MDLYEEEVGNIEIPNPHRYNICPRQAADEEGVEAAVNMLRSASFPVIIASTEVTASRAQERLLALAQMLSAPVFSEPFLGYHHPNYFGSFKVNHEMVKKADVILVVGGDVIQATYPSDPEWNRDVKNILGDKKYVHLTTIPLAIGKQTAADVGLVADIGVALEQICKKMREGRLDEKRKSEILNRGRFIEEQKARQEGQKEKAKNRTTDQKQVLIENVVAELSKTFGDNAVIVNHGTSGRKYLDQLYDFSSSCTQEYFTLSPKGSAQGWGLPAAIGMQLAMPEKRVVAWVGDGGFMFTAQALWTAAKFDIPVIAIVLNNGGWRNFKYDKGEEAFAFKFENPTIDYAGIARSMGVIAQRIDRPEDVRPGLERAKQMNVPVFLEIVADF